ncbi:MAG: hypothetical protein GC162_03105 [Planctomycetes bacterium]|nr:hypothetical protein [Planctomycetota bacterium]
MKRPLALLMVLCAASIARAEHFDVRITVEAGSEVKTSYTDPHDDPNAENEIPTIDVTHDQTFIFQFTMTNVYPHKIRKDVGVHYSITRQNNTNNTTADPKILDGEFQVNFKPQGMAGLRQKLQIHDPGQYLIFVTSLHSGSDHEHFSKMMLNVK